VNVASLPLTFNALDPPQIVLADTQVVCDS